MPMPRESAFPIQSQPGVKVTVIGGGSSYTPELILGFLQRRAAFPLRELWLHDTDPLRLEVVGGFARRMVAAHGSPFSVHLSTERRAALAGAKYVLTQLRVGQMAARREDEYLGLRHGLIGQETTGVGGMAKALRTIPVLLDIARDLAEVAPGATLVNFTNPAGLVTEALTQCAPDVRTIGVCNVPVNAQRDLTSLLSEVRGEAIAPERTALQTLGLNHLSWHSDLLLDGESTWPELRPAYLEQSRAAGQWDAPAVEILDRIPSYYLRYFYQTAEALAEGQHWPPSRAEEVMALEAELLRQYAEPERTMPPEGLLQRGGAYYSTVATQLLTALEGDLGEVQVLNVRQAGAVADWPSDWVLELPCRVDAGGAHPLPAEALPAVCAGLVQQLKAYELLTVQAAVFGDRQAARQALLAHPLGPAASQVNAVLDDLLQTHQAYLPRFFD